MIEVTDNYIKIFDDKKNSCISYNRNYYKVAYVGDCISIVKKDFNERNKSLHTNIDKIYDEFEKTIKELQDKYNTQQEVLKKLIVDSINKE